MVEPQPERRAAHVRAGRGRFLGPIAGDFPEEGEREMDLLARHRLASGHVRERQGERLERARGRLVRPHREEEPHR